MEKASYINFRRTGWGVCKASDFEYMYYDLFTNGHEWLLVDTGKTPHQLITPDEAKSRHFISLNSNGHPLGFTVGKFLNKNTSHENLMEFAAAYPVEGISF